MEQKEKPQKEKKQKEKLKKENEINDENQYEMELGRLLFYIIAHEDLRIRLRMFKIIFCLNLIVAIVDFFYLGIFKTFFISIMTLAVSTYIIDKKFLFKKKLVMLALTHFIVIMALTQTSTFLLGYKIGKFVLLSLIFNIFLHYGIKKGSIIVPAQRIMNVILFEVIIGLIILWFKLNFYEDIVFEIISLIILLTMMLVSIFRQQDLP